MAPMLPHPLPLKPCRTRDRALRLVLFTSLFATSQYPYARLALAQAPVTEPPAAELTLLPGDLLSVEIWREEDLSGQFVIDHDGFVVLPMLGELQVTHLPFRDLRDSLLTAYRRELRNPSITITPLRRIYVLGAVNEPGMLAVDPTVFLDGVIARAGGANEIGDLRRIQLVRDGQVIREDLSHNTAISRLDVRSGDQIIVGRRSWFDRNSTVLVSAVVSVASIIVLLIR